MEIPEYCPQSVLVGYFDEHKNNTEESKDEKVERSFEGEEITFAPRSIMGSLMSST